jgi:hypothetical protein
MTLSDMQHQICKMSLQGKLHLVPLKKETMKHALDFATGTGIWAIDFGIPMPIHLINKLT